MDYTRESIFVSSIRSFCTSLGAILGILIGIVVLAVVFLILSPPSFVPEKTELVVAADAEGKRELLSPTSPVLLRIDFHGVIGAADLNSDTMNNILIDSREGMLKGNRVKGILLHMDTPGGTVTDADNIYRAIKAYKQKYNVPVFAYVDGLCASGGMYISSAADRIFSSPTGVIGSIGVLLGPTFNFSQAMDKWGIESLTITQGKDKDALNPFRPWKPGEDSSLRAITASLYEQFVTIVTEARPRLSKEKLINQYGANVFIASEAEEHGYIEKAAGLDEKTHYQVFQIMPKMPFFSEFTQGCYSLLRGKVTHTFQMGPYLNSEMSGKFLYLYQP
jgi:signal peptide peptidase SppA